MGAIICGLKICNILSEQNNHIHGVPSEKADSKRLSFLTLRLNIGFFHITLLVQAVNLIKCIDFCHVMYLDYFLVRSMSSHFLPI